MRGKLMIVDDEQLIRRGLVKMIEFCPVSWAVAGEAAEGEEALALLDTLAPDLVITDIRMPQMDGIELCRRIAELNRPVDVIVLTAHKDFEFAQAALRYGAIDFLLKPCSMEELAASLGKAYAKFLDRQHLQEQQRLEEARRREEGVRSWLLGVPMDEAAMEAVRLGSSGQAHMVWNVESYTPADRSYRAEDARLMQFAVLNIMKELFALHGLAGSITTVKQDMFAVLAEPGEGWALFCRETPDTVRKLLGIALAPILQGDGPLERLYGRLAGQSGKGEGAEEQAGMAQDQRSRHIQPEILSFIVQGKTEELLSYLDALVRELGRMSPQDARIEALNLAMALAETARKELEGAEPAGSMMGRWVQELQPFVQSGQAAAWAEERVRRFMWQLDSWLARKNENVMKKALYYVEEHYKDNCTIHQAAACVHLSVSYFSNLFKKETGETFTNYLAKFRMEKAKILLSNTNMKIAEIAESTGYDDPNYFTTVFRHWNRISPSEYRKQSQSPHPSA